MTNDSIHPWSSVAVDRYFLDESGHGGDLASAKALDFAGQPFFALACVARRMLRCWPRSWIVCA
jgi:hypothetical protein